MIWFIALACGVVAVPAALRWLRVAQREHYLAPSTTRFAWRWWTNGPINTGLFVVAVVGVVGTLWSAWFGFLVPAAQIGPVGLGVRGSTSTLAWTDRLRRLAALVGGFVVVLFLIGGLTNTPFLVVLGLFALPALVDLGLALMAPLEKRMGDKWVDRAAAKLDAVGAQVVAITGSYGKTTTKNYVAHLLTGSRRVVASPASFNNRMGLARAINENLAPGTEVFVAEMGTYGPGEIADLCNWITPDVAAMVAIGPVHLERFRTEERIVAAKSEILDRADVGVICVDHPLLAELARERSPSMRVIEVATDGDSVAIDSRIVGGVPEGAFLANLATALGIGVALGVEIDEMIPRLADLPVAEHRQSISQSETGFTIIDDTFNSNPAGARLALDRLAELGSQATKVVVTPGMVELGPVQVEENERFAAEAAGVADHIFIVGQTNKRALLRGSARGRASVTVVDSREEAVAWARANLNPGDVVLYENDLPDHYP